MQQIMYELVKIIFYEFMKFRQLQVVVSHEKNLVRAKIVSRFLFTLIRIEINDLKDRFTIFIEDLSPKIFRRVCQALHIHLQTYFV